MPLDISKIPSSKPLMWCATTFILFMVFSCVGWCYEILNDFIVQGGFHPRASLAGPWCPIYGIGGLLIIWVFKPIRARIKDKVPIVPQALLLAVGIYLLVTCVELAGSYICESTMGFMPWDYSSSWGNFEGRIAPEFTLRFVIGGLVFLYLVEPAVVGWGEKHPKALLLTAALLLVLFVCDMALEAAGVWKDIIPRDAGVFVK